MRPPGFPFRGEYHISKSLNDKDFNCPCPCVTVTVTAGSKYRNGPLDTCHAQYSLPVKSQRHGLNGTKNVTLNSLSNSGNTRVRRHRFRNLSHYLSRSYHLLPVSSLASRSSECFWLFRNVWGHRAKADSTSGTSRSVYDPVATTPKNVSDLEFEDRI